MIPLVKTKMPPPSILMPALEEALYSGYIAQGETVDEFEKSFSNYVGNKYSLSVNSGSAALHVALILAGVKPGDEVISTPITAEPTNTVIKQVGAKIVWGDVDPHSGNLDAADVERKITPKTKAIMVVDYAGIPVEINKFKEIEKKFNIPIIEDAAHALGAVYENRHIGNQFRFTIFSFQAIKAMTTVDGGMLALSRESDYKRGKLLRWFGIDKTLSRLENNIHLQGYKYHMNNINALIGLIQLRFLKETIATYVENGKYFDFELKNIPGLELLRYPENSQPSYWLYTCKVDNRAAFINKLASHGIMASELHKRNDSHALFSESKIELPNTECFSKKMVHIPCGWWVGQNERKLIADTIKGGW
jgi:perosamine synthetase